ncbi:MAG: RimK family alpha-L-glutamate ligase [Bacteroidetes bacterium]|nr:MAG: RimK family alpha-L-glutamate ligase [Bacteroidota bacterium]
MDLDAVIPRIGASVTFYGAAVIQQFELMGVYTAARADALLQARDKLRSLQLLAAAGMDIPRTFIVNNPDVVGSLIDELGGPPVVIKLLESTHGLGVILAETRKTAISIVEAFQRTNQKVIVQEFIEEARGADIRVLVVGGRVVAAMRRQAVDGEFRSNLHRGASATRVKLRQEEVNLVQRAVKLLGLDVAGVDLLRSRRGPLLLEINASPGLEGIETITGVDIAGAIIEHVVRRARKLAAYRSRQLRK